MTLIRTPGHLQLCKRDLSRVIVQPQEEGPTLGDKTLSIFSCSQYLDMAASAFSCQNVLI